ncbi:Glutamine-dependent NAD(+) synthetase(Carbon-nitrogen hydrolase,2-242;Rossmann-like alpha/beta/alpha sandwich fold,257-532) [Magnetospirillum sp. XM-1]|uniref:NAD+ synthase n=1 Tax=Magnetospirillum sp. XM-1 TaxID=1663591 RepID=UPI00073DB775|nr:NAD+ synthase [Magnetospirillum sp. XM-1]CUW38934.1 Glutamine-dependent NAD(+) synthetase(Carbon-nitrogen hydrolase,2-242;Rossmann-like alpha/beta/alpha sandwich fold,257-532) [Magnetospirillum sp. XM-1]
MSDTLSIALAQINPVVGDVAGNLALIRAARAKGAELGADLVVFGELTICGYPPEDLVLKGAFLDACEAAVNELAAETESGPAVLVGAPWRVKDKLHNAALLLDHGRVAATRLKHHLPNYGVFDEVRVFQPGPAPGPVSFRGVRLGIMICEDMWYQDVAETLGESGAEILVVPNGSPFEMDKPTLRLDHARARVEETGLALVYVNQVGGQDELVFDGASFVLNGDGKVAASLAPWQSEVALTKWTREPSGWRCEGPKAPPTSRLEGVYQALVTGLRDYVGKNRFPGVVLGLSGGIDSAICAAIAADALGPDKVWCVMMPSPYTSVESLEDAAECARLLGVRLDTVNIGPAMGAFDQMLAPLFVGKGSDITEENLQSRSRGLTLMGISNKFGPMVLSTGNKSEMSCGYATLYGDMCGGYAVLKDVYKTTVFALSSWRNLHRPPGCLGPDGPVMPDRVITKPPSAELKPDQKDQDTLPPYDELDSMLEAMIEEEKSVAEITAAGFDEAVVKRVWRMLDRAEYKRRQAPPGVKISSRSFGRDRRYPITNAFTSLI